MMAGDTALEAALRRDRLIVVVSLAGVAALAWAYLFVLAKAMTSMEGPGGWGAFMGLMPMGRWGVLEYALAFSMWALMMVGMMIPSAVPMILLYARVARRTLPRVVASLPRSALSPANRLAVPRSRQEFAVS